MLKFTIYHTDEPNLLIDGASTVLDRSVHFVFKDAVNNICTATMHILSNTAKYEIGYSTDRFVFVCCCL